MKWHGVVTTEKHFHKSVVFRSGGYSRAVKLGNNEFKIGSIVSARPAITALAHPDYFMEFVADAGISSHLTSG
jgi:hypothetical protein